MKKLSAILRIGAELGQVLSCREVWNFRKRKISLWTDKNKITFGKSILVTDVDDKKNYWNWRKWCWWLSDIDSFKLVVAKFLCWWLFRWNKSVTNIRLQNSSPLSVTNIDVAVKMSSIKCSSMLCKLFSIILYRSFVLLWKCWYHLWFF